MPCKLRHCTSGGAALRIWTSDLAWLVMLYPYFLEMDRRDCVTFVSVCHVRCDVKISTDYFFFFAGAGAGGSTCNARAAARRSLCSALSLGEPGTPTSP